MTDLTLAASVRQAEHDAMATDVERFLAAGGEIEQIPRGAMVEAGWKPRQVINPQVMTATRRRAEIEERDARKKAEAAIPYAPSAAGRPPGVAPGSQKARILELLAATPGQSARLLAAQVGTSREVVNQHLAILRDKGLVVSEGPRHAMVWSLT